MDFILCRAVGSYVKSPWSWFFFVCWQQSMLIPHFCVMQIPSSVKILYVSAVAAMLHTTSLPQYSFYVLLLLLLRLSFMISALSILILLDMIYRGITCCFIFACLSLHSFLMLWSSMHSRNFGGNAEVFQLSSSSPAQGHYSILYFLVNVLFYYVKYLSEFSATEGTHFL